MSKYQFITHKATLFGTMFGGAEEWSTGFFLGQNGGGDEGAAPTVAEATAIANAFSTFFVKTTVGISDRFKFAGVKISTVSTDGTSDPALTQFYTLPTPVSGAQGVLCMPPQISLAATLQTLRTRGRGSKGRMYLPGISFSVDATGHISTTDQTGINSALKIFLDSVNSAVDVPGVVVLNSAEVLGVPIKAPEMARIASCKVGNVYDTQRRRRNQLSESYISATLA